MVILTLGRQQDSFASKVCCVTLPQDTSTTKHSSADQDPIKELSEDPCTDRIRLLQLQTSRVAISCDKHLSITSHCVLFKFRFRPHCLQESCHLPPFMKCVEEC